MDERVWIALGVLMVIVGVVLAIYAGPLDMRAQSTYAAGDLDAGESLRLRSDAFRYGGLGIASLGVVLMTGSWVKYLIESSKRF